MFSPRDMVLTADQLNFVSAALAKDLVDWSQESTMGLNFTNPVYFLEDAFLRVQVMWREDRKDYLVTTW